MRASPRTPDRPPADPLAPQRRAPGRRSRAAIAPQIRRARDWFRPLGRASRARGEDASERPLETPAGRGRRRPSWRRRPPHGGAVAEGFADEGDEVLGALGGVAELLEALVDLGLVAACLELLEAGDLGALGFGVDAKEGRDVEFLLDELVDADDDVLLGAVALLVAPGALVDLVGDELDGLGGAANLVDLAMSSQARCSISSVRASTK